MVWPADRIEKWPLAKLVPYARNARVHSDAQIDQIAASIREWGWTVPVLIDDEGGIIAGHARVLAATKLGLDDVPVMIATGWSEAQKRAYVLADNKLSLNSDWDSAFLAVELADLEALGFDAKLTGFSVDEIAKLVDPSGEAPEEFGSFDETIETAHECPKCGYRWSGGRTVEIEPEGQDEQDDGGEYDRQRA